MIYFSKITEAVKKRTEAGTELATEYAVKIDKETGHKTVYESGRTNLYDKIQSYKESTDINNIIRRYKLGDTTALNKYNTVFADVTNMPTTLAEAQAMIANIKQEFEKLPAEVKRKYDFSVEKFIAAENKPVVETETVTEAEQAVENA